MTDSTYAPSKVDEEHALDARLPSLRITASPTVKPEDDNNCGKKPKCCFFPRRTFCREDFLNKRPSRRLAVLQVFSFVKTF